MADLARAFLGRGWTFPPARLGHDAAMAEYEEDIRQAVLIILGTDREERAMRPDFGAGLSAFLFEPISTGTAERLRVRILEALIDWESRILVVQVSVAPMTGQLPEAAVPAGFRPVPGGAALLVTIEYRVRATNAVRNLVFPFYLNEGR
jgi:phage baseplate assembly protein W